MSTIEERFKGLINRIHYDRVAIFIDDLDRCESQYVVGLLEGIQTLFREAPVVFVVAGDRHWIDTSFEKVYESQAENHTFVGKTLGMLFLEKTFQFTAPVPRISKPVQEAFVEAVTGISDARAESKNDGTEEYLTNVEKAEDERELLSILEQGSSDSELSPEGNRAVRSAVVRKFGTAEVREQTENVLIKFVPLLEPNPRGIKRLVNTYGVNRSLATLAHANVSQDQLALWTILSMRWPALADTLVESPDLLMLAQKPGLLIEGSEMDTDDHIELALLLGFRPETSKSGVEYRRGTLNSSESALV